MTTVTVPMTVAVAPHATPAQATTAHATTAHATAHAATAHAAPVRHVVQQIAVLLATALGTSIDAMAAGVPLAFLDVNILVISLAIGAATFVMSTGGMLADD
jgi:putative Mn2+ efflux pump MntP